MNAHALLTAQGWRGTGNSLHPTNNSIGLTKPLLVGRKNDNNGLGQKHHTSDMWWMKAFDQSLQALETSHDGTAIKTMKSGDLNIVKRGGSKWILAKGGLYANFIKGDGLAGSIESRVSENLQARNSSDTTTNDSIVLCEYGGKVRGARKVRKHSSKVPEKIKDHKMSDISQRKIVIETKEHRKARRAAKRLLRQNTHTTTISPCTEEIYQPADVTKKRKRCKIKQDGIRREETTCGKNGNSRDKLRKKKKKT